MSASPSNIEDSGMSACNQLIPAVERSDQLSSVAETLVLYVGSFLSLAVRRLKCCVLLSICILNIRQCQNSTMGKRKNTAKTGDKKVYASRETGVGTKKTITNEDSLESFHKQRDDEFLRLGEAEEGPGKGDAIDESFLQKQHVLDLGITDESSGDDNDLDDGDESSQEDFHNEVSNVSDPTSSSSDEDDYDDDDDDEIEKMKEDPRRWGKKKASYYDGDTGDLEIGQDEEVCELMRGKLRYRISDSELTFLLLRMHMQKKLRQKKFNLLALMTWLMMILNYQMVTATMAAPRQRQTGSKRQCVISPTLQEKTSTSS